MRTVILVFILMLTMTVYAVQAKGVANVSDAVDDNQGKTGRYQKTVTLSALMGEEGARAFEGAVEPGHEIHFDVYVPNTYDPSRPAGVLVFVSPTISGQIPKKWKKIFDRRNLIWVSVGKSGNKVSALRRIAEASVSPAFIAQNYKINPDRIYLSGFSGGGRISSYTASYYPELFKGTIFICGVNPWAQTPPPLFDIIKKNRFVFLSGTQDFNLRETKKVYKLYNKAGVENTKLMVVANMAHAIPDSTKYDEAIGFLDKDLP
ncbi:MAG: hypothetical protein GXP06_05935 [Alphaproteobacteria bacterium]|nr:hypothetical protein [Alphaproteobacteria bacterium]